MKDALKQISWSTFNIGILAEYDPHLLVLDSVESHHTKQLVAVKHSNPALPIICLYDSMSESMQEELIQIGVHKNIQEASLRFCGQILYRSIHGYAIHSYYQKQARTQKQIEKSIRGLEKIQTFWGKSYHKQDVGQEKVLSEISETLDYLSKLQEKLVKSMKANNT
ncbi:MAG: hypothetical protein AAF696_33810 [Bacteroidota bacterium]